MVSMHMGMASMVLLQAVRAGGAPRCIQPPRPGHCLCMSLGGFTWLWDGQLKFVAVVCLLVTMGMDMNEWLIAWIALLKAVHAVCAPKCFNPHGIHGIAWSCSIEDYRALLWLVCIWV